MRLAARPARWALGAGGGRWLATEGLALGLAKRLTGRRTVGFAPAGWPIGRFAWLTGRLSEWLPRGRPWSPRFPAGFPRGGWTAKAVRGVARGRWAGFQR